ncbi:MAG: ketopantoate reductase family protein, partial [Oscillospiraceae bacterium]
MKEIKTVALVGLGAIGAYFADRLQPVLGDDLRVIAGGARAERIRREGLVINGKQEYYHVVEPGEGEPADLVIFATKMSGLQQAIEDVRAQIGPETLILSPLNGVESEEVVAKTYGWENIVYSLMRISSVKVGNTVSFDPNAAFYVEYGEKKNDPANLSERVLRLKALFDGAGIRYQIRPDMLLAIWEKFACNVSENQVAAVLDLPYGAWGSCEDAEALRIM